VTEEPYPRPAYAWYVVIVLMIAYVSSFIDRQILGLLVQPIRRDLAISDTQMSLLYGLSFAAFYTLVGIPVGRLADSRSRRAIIAVGIAMWSVMTILCGTADSYGELLLYRFGVGIGEAALTAPAFSLIADYFPPARYGAAIGAFSMGIYIGAGLANLIGGLVLQFVAASDAWTLPILGSVRAWQTVFVFIGLPGLAIAALMLTVREPRRRGRGLRTGGASVAEVIDYLRANALAFGSLTLALSLNSLVNFGTASWLPTYLIRAFDWTAPQAGYVLGSLTIVLGSAGVASGGRIADRLLRRGHADAKVRVCIGSAIAQLITGVLYLSMPSAPLAVLWLVPFNFFAAFPFGAAAAAVQEITPPTMRAQASALYLFFINLIGLGLGPTAVALLTDRVFGSDAAVGRSMLVVTMVGMSGAALLLTIGRRAYARSAVAARG
jgi:MFS family permease